VATVAAAPLQRKVFTLYREHVFRKPELCIYCNHTLELTSAPPHSDHVAENTNNKAVVESWECRNPSCFSNRKKQQVVADSPT
jgi:uncharacterized protein with PIN domain